MMIIEALNELRTIKRRLLTYRDEIEKYASRLSNEAPYFDSDEEQTHEVMERVGTCETLIYHYLTLRQGIMYTNLQVRVPFQGKTYSLHELLDLRRELGSLLRAVYLAMNDRHAETRRSQMRSTLDTASTIRLYDERVKNQKLHDWEDFLATIDGRLEIINATTALLPVPNLPSPPTERGEAMPHADNPLEQILDMAHQSTQPPQDPVHYDDWQHPSPDRDPQEGTGPGWYFYDETSAFRYGPYDTEALARSALECYVLEVLAPRDPDRLPPEDA